MTRRRLFVGLTVLGLGAGAAGIFYYLEAGRYERDFVGWKDSDVVAVLGKPHFDSRLIHSGHADHHVLGWYYFWGRQLALAVKDGTVFSQTYSSK